MPKKSEKSKAFKISANDLKNLNRKLLLEVPSETRAGVHASDALCSLSKEFFALTFYHEEPLDSKVAIGTARVFMPTSKLKPLRDLLDRQIKLYEKEFGRIK